MIMRRDPVLFAWVAGLSLAALVYVVGPDRFLFRLEDMMHVLAWRIAEAIDQLSASALDVIRALAIGIYATFIGLAITVQRRGGRARFAALVVTGLFILVVSGAGPGDQTRWIAALVLSGVGASVMTGRLRQAGLPARV